MHMGVLVEIKDSITSGGAGVTGGHIQVGI